MPLTFCPTDFKRANLKKASFHWCSSVICILSSFCSRATWFRRPSLGIRHLAVSVNSRLAASFWFLRTSVFHIRAAVTKGYRFLWLRVDEFAGQTLAGVYPINVQLLKRQHFFKYKDDATVACHLVFSRDTEELYRICIKNVENFMELWNTNNEFRSDYVKFNARSIVIRFGTLDGRPLGPDDEPHILSNSYVDERVNRIISTTAKVDLESQFPTLEPNEERIVGSVSSVDKSMKKVAEEKYRSATNKGSSIFMQVNDSNTVSGLDITYEEPKKSREEIEAIKK